MLISSSPFPPLPKDTAYAAEIVLGRGHTYLSIGDQIEQLLTGIDLAPLDPASRTSRWTLTICALITIFQFVENLPDERAVEATRARPDWKYALHLPLAYPGFDRRVLKEFRQYVARNAAARQAFQQILDRLTDLGLLSSAIKPSVDAANVLSAVSDVNRLA